MSHASRSPVAKPSRLDDMDLAPAARNDPSVVALSLVSPTVAQTQWASRHLDPPRTERVVVSRTRFHITLPTPLSPSGPNKAAANDEQCGWSSPNGEPYRPLGRPELNLKFSPQLVYGVSPMMQNARRVRTLEGGGVSSAGANSTAGNSVGLDKKDKELREPSSTTNPDTPIAALVGQFVASLASRKRPLDERQAKLAHRLQASVGGFSPERVRGLHRQKLQIQDQQPENGGGGKQNIRPSPRGDTSIELLREAIDKGTSRLRSTRNGTSLLQKLPPTELQGIRELQEQYLRTRMMAPQPVAAFTNGGVRANPRGLLGAKKTPPDKKDMRHQVRFNNGEDTPTGCSNVEEGQALWYLPYTTRQLQRSPHRRLPSLQEFQARARDEKHPLRPLRASSNVKTNTPGRMRASTGRSSFVLPRTSMAPVAVALCSEGEPMRDKIIGPTATSSAGKAMSSPFAISTTPVTPASPVPMHSIEKLQAAVDALETTKHQQSVRLATALGVLEQDRRECLAENFRSLNVRCDALDDLREMREHSERRRGQRVLEVVSKTEDWYPELLRRLLTREIGSNVGLGTASAGVGSLVPLHAAEIFIIQAVRCFSNEGYEFRPTQLFQVILHLHHDDLALLQVHQLLEYLRNELHIDCEDWVRFFESHNLPEPVADLADDRKDTAKSCLEVPQV